MLGNSHDAEDVLQDAFCLAYVNVRKLKEPAAFGAWLKRIVVNECLKALKKRVSFSSLDNCSTEMDGEPDFVAEGISLEQINHEIKQLPDGCRIVFTLFLLEDFSHKQIAEMLQISESTSKSQYQRARQLLQKRLAMVIQQSELIM
jgi:RNA polymerase sigma-70 factor (ECF subfamily)